MTVRGDGIGVTRLVWRANARSVGLGIVQVPFWWMIIISLTEREICQISTDL